MAFGHLHIRNSVGLFGEKAAVDLLKKKGYKILEQNWKIGHLEVDIIAENKTDIAFVEVKTRTSVFGRMPEEYVDRTKQHRIKCAANAYIKAKQCTKNPRFDVIGILTNESCDKILYINHLEDAFQPRVRTYGLPF